MRIKIMILLILMMILMMLVPVLVVVVWCSAGWCSVLGGAPGAPSARWWSWSFVASGWRGGSSRDEHSRVRYECRRRPSAKLRTHAGRSYDRQIHVSLAESHFSVVSVTNAHE